MDPTPFWAIQVPTNLGELIAAAEKHVAKIKAYRDPDSDKSYVNQSLQYVAAVIAAACSTFRF